MKPVIYIICGLLILSVSACKQAGEMMYSGLDYLQMSDTATLRHNFFYDEAEIRRDTFILILNTVGEIHPYPRAFALKQIPEYKVVYQYDELDNIVDSSLVQLPNQATEGDDYVPFDDPEIVGKYIIPANRNQVQIPVIVKRTPRLRQGELRLCIQIQENEHFLQGDKRLLSRTVVFTDRLSRLVEWDVAPFPTYFGNYSVRKHEFMAEIAETKIDENWVKSVRADIAALRYWQNTFKLALIKYNSDPDNLASGLAPMKDENDRLVIFDKEAVN